MSDDVMNTAGSKNALDFFTNISALKVMLVLYRDNPDVSLGALQKETQIEIAELSELVRDMMCVDLLTIKPEDNGDLLTLSDEARMSLNRLKAKEKMLC